MFSEVPEDWQTCSLREVVEIVRNGTSSSQSRMPTDFPVSRIETISEEFIDFSSVGYLSDPEPKYLMQPGDILFSHINSIGHVGKCAIYRDEKPLYHGMNLLLIRPDSNTVSADYLFLVLSSRKGQANTRREARPAINQVSLTQKQVLSLPIPLPPLPEQRRIAEVLDAADEAIRRTERVIAKLREIKKGLLHDLLTRGLDADGNLRDPDAHPEQFKDSPLGRIPREWRIERIGGIASIKYGISDPIDQTLQEGIPTITLPCISAEGDLSIDDDLLALTAKEKVSRRDLLQAGDLLFNWRSGSQRHLGKTAYFDHDGQYTHVGFLLNIRANPTLCNARYLWWHMIHLKDRGFFLRAKSQVNNTFNSSELAEVPIPIPTITEQIRIIESLDAHDARIRAEEATLDKLRQVKRGLMDDLLTGRVRVSVESSTCLKII